MLPSPLKKLSHSRNSSKNSNTQREASSEAKSSMSHSHPQQKQSQASAKGPSQHPPQQREQVRATSMDLARQYESDRAKITRFCFSRREPDGQLHESYITHVRIVEDSHYPSSRPPPNANPAHKKQRFLMIGVKKTGRVRLHKGRENKDGSVQVGRTWDLDELTKAEKDLVVSTGFFLTLGKTYYWETSTAKEVIVFNTSLLSTYVKYTSKIPELVNWDLNALGIQPPVKSVGRNASQPGAGRNIPPAPAQIPSQKHTGPPPMNATERSFEGRPLQIPKPRQGSQPLVAAQTPPTEKKPLQIDPPRQPNFSQKNPVLGSSSSSLPSSRIGADSRAVPSSSGTSASTVEQVPIHRTPNDPVNKPVTAPLNLVKSQTPDSTAPADKISAVSSKSSKNVSELSVPAKTFDDSQLSREVSAPQSVATGSASVQGVSFNKNRASYIEVEKETDDSGVHGEDDDDYDDNYDVTGYYGDDASPEEDSLDDVGAAADTKPLNFRSALDPSGKGARYNAEASDKSQEFAEELFSKVKWSTADDAAALEKKLTRQLVVSENESCQALINLGDGNIGLKQSLDSCLSECNKLGPLIAFFNVELASYKDELNQISTQADFVGLNNRKALRAQLVSKLQ